MVLENLDIDLAEKVKQRGGYDLRGLKCDLMALAEPKILAKNPKPVIWKVRWSA